MRSVFKLLVAVSSLLAAPAFATNYYFSAAGSDLTAGSARVLLGVQFLKSTTCRYGLAIR
jgi:hypothetical protein